MKFYKVTSGKLEHAFNDLYYPAGIDAYRLKKGVRYSYQYIGNELFTPSELKNILGFTEENKPDFLKPVEIKKGKTHFFFGCRFEDENPVYYYKDGTPANNTNR